MLGVWNVFLQLYVETLDTQRIFNIKQKQMFGQLIQTCDSD